MIQAGAFGASREMSMAGIAIVLVERKAARRADL